jgi:RNA-binding protein
MPDLTSAKRRNLRSRAHHLQPVVMIGEAGLTPQVLAELETSLKSHELIKIRILSEDRVSRRNLMAAICAATGADPVQQIGRMLVIFRLKPQAEDESEPPQKRKRAPGNAARSTRQT